MIFIPPFGLDCFCCGRRIDLSENDYVVRDEGEYCEDCGDALCFNIDPGDENTICRVNCQCGCSFCWTEGEHPAHPVGIGPCKVWADH